MHYALLIYEDDAAYAGEDDPAWLAVLEAHQRFAEALAAQGLLRGGAGLKAAATATTVRRTGGGHSLHDGPYAEAREQLGGFYIIEAPDLDAALAWARKLPLNGDGAIEVRPALEDM